MKTSKPKPKLSDLQGYDARIEYPRAYCIRQFFEAQNPNDQRAAMDAVARLTALRSPTFIAAYEAARGILDE